MVLAAHCGRGGGDHFVIRRFIISVDDRPAIHIDIDAINRFERALPECGRVWWHQLSIIEQSQLAIAHDNAVDAERDREEPGSCQ
jgi:hypothetical protein